MSPLERETKLVLSQQDFQKVRRTGRLVEEKDQLNIYLHDPSRLGEDLGYFRVRFESGSDPVATLKIPVGWIGGTREMVEVERPLSELGPALFPRPRRWVPVVPNVPEGLMEHFLSLGITHLRRLGWMRNSRTVLELGSLGRIELDRFSLPGRGSLFEVEIEHPSDEVHRVLVEEIRILAPSAEISTMGKFSRFLSAKGLR